MRFYTTPTIEVTEIEYEEGVAMSVTTPDKDSFPGGWDNDSEVELN